MNNFVFLCAIVILLLESSIFSQTNNKIELNSISFIGNKSFNSEQLKLVLVSKETPNKLSKFFNSFTPFGEEPSYFDSLSLPTDISLLNSFYRAHGFFEREINYSFTVNDDSTEADLTFNIKEGNPYFFRKYERKGLESVLKHILADALEFSPKIDSTVRFSENVVQRDITTLTKYLRDRGYMFFTSEIPEVLVDTLHNKVDVTINFVPGSYYRVDSVIVKKEGVGKDYVEDNLIKEIAGLKFNSPLSEYDLSSAQVRLYRTNLFSSAEVSPLIFDTLQNRVPLVIETEIGLMNEFNPEIILNSEDNTLNLGFRLGYARKNFFGNARRLKIQGAIAAQDMFHFIANPELSKNIYGYADARISLEQPFLFGKLINTKIEAYNTLQKRKENYNTYLIGSNLEFDFDMPANVYLTDFLTYLNWEHSKTVLQDEYIIKLFESGLEQSAPDLTPEEIKDSAGVLAANVSGENKKYSTNNTVLGINLNANKTNNLIFPTKGYRVGATIENSNAVPYLFSKIGNYEFTNPLYFKLVLNASYFYPFSNSLKDAMGTKLIIGNINTYSGDKFDIPINQRFTAGGSNSNRGWGNRELVPRGVTIPDSLEGRPIEELESLFLRHTLPGGFFWLEGSFETRNRIWQDLGGAIFIDYANVWNSVKDFRWDGIAVGVGFGFRYYTAFAPFRIDFGFKLFDPADRRPITHKNIFSEVFQFHLGVGEAF